MKEDYNCYCKLLLKEDQYQPSNKRFFDSGNRPRWKEFIKYGDESGFDIRYKAPNGYHIERVILPVGKKIIRYGNASGSFTTDEGTDYSLLSLPYIKESLPYHEYIVLEECEVQCLVDKGKVAPGFNSPGGAVQYRHYYTMHDSIRQGIIKEDFKWLDKQ